MIATFKYFNAMRLWELILIWFVIAAIIGFKFGQVLGIVIHKLFLFGWTLPRKIREKNTEDEQ